LAVQAVEPYFKSVSGKLLSAQEPRYLAHGSLYDRAGHLLDELLCVRFAAGQSFTGEAVVELQAHGGTFHLQSIQKALLEANRELATVRLARPGEFTQRAFLNGKLDLTRAEAIADLIHSAPVWRGMRPRGNWRAICKEKSTLCARAWSACWPMRGRL